MRRERLAATQARRELSRILHEFERLEHPSASIEDRAVRLGIYNDDAGVLVPLVDFERAVETEQLLDDLLIELAIAERLAAGPGRAKPVEQVARELGFQDELELE